MRASLVPWRTGSDNFDTVPHLHKTWKNLSASRNKTIYSMLRQIDITSGKTAMSSFPDAPQQKMKIDCVLFTDTS
jgi:hypothetical protein